MSVTGNYTQQTITSKVPGPRGLTGPVGAGGAVGHYLTGYSSQIQTNASVVNAMTFNVVESSNGITIADNSKIVFSHAGTYNIQFSTQLDKTDSGNDNIDIWLAVDGTDVPWSNTRVLLAGNSAKGVAAWNFLVDVNAASYAQLRWYSADSDVRLYAENGQLNPTRPGIPSIILTVHQVMYTQTP